MEFELSKAQKQIQKAASDFAKGEFDKELAIELDRKHEFPKKIWKKAADLGFIGIHYPEEYSGQGLGVLENIIIADPQRREIYQKTLDSSGLGSINLFGIIALETAYNQGEEWLEQLLVYIQGNFNYNGMDYNSFNTNFFFEDLKPSYITEDEINFRLDVGIPWKFPENTGDPYFSGS